MAKFEVVLHDSPEVYNIWLTGTEGPTDLTGKGGKPTPTLSVGDAGVGAGLKREWSFWWHGKFCFPGQPHNFRGEDGGEVRNKDPRIRSRDINHNM